ncbi:putative methyltransferase [Roseiarcus fermentans]|uniref:Putative methyltransferase n=1 Tax=Roseiarcus fermentans TaxID=1473586 RepID=A0A366F806_9HYPH|nr:methyltransferase domain-containing protein [Roseiarcus fermentans]RBP09845.1 putative methyltransferase [Roseiarcus fermentans]
MPDRPEKSVGSGACAPIAVVLPLLAGLLCGLGAPARAADPALEAAVHNPGRSAKFVARDGARHPFEELAFFGVTPSATVVEIWPGGGYWTEILAPLLHDHGTYYVALEGNRASETANAESEKLNAAFRRKIEGDPATYSRILPTVLGVGETDVAPAGSADVVLTFRNLHNWLADGAASEALAGIYRALKPGGVLGIEEHRGQRDTPQDPRAADGYVRQDYAIALAQKAGFAFVAASEIGANPKDTANWPKGVWTLPPTFALGDQDKATYAAIGEADNFVLKFRKPGP